MAANTASSGVNVNELIELGGVRECLQFFTREKQWINEVHLEFCRVPAPTFLEAERAAWFQERFRALGWEAAIDRAGNVTAYLGPGPYIAVTAHLDTVLAPRQRRMTSRWMAKAASAVRASPITAPGLAALLAVARACKTARLRRMRPRRLLLVANTGEEGEGNLVGMRHLCRQSPLAEQIRGFVVVDGANTDHITTRALGSRRFEVTFSGPGGHSWSDFGVGNPIHALCRAVALFAETRVEGSPKSSVNVGLIEGGSGVNAIAQSARAKVDIRSESNQRIEDLVEALTAAVDRAREVGESAGHRRAGRRQAEGDRIAARRRRCPTMRRCSSTCARWTAHLGIRSHLDTSSTDANMPLSLGIPAVALGAGGVGGGAHTTQEWFSPDGRDLGLKRIFLTLMLMLRDAGGREREVSRGRAEAALAVNTVVWGATFVLAKAALGYVSPVLLPGMPVQPGGGGAAGAFPRVLRRRVTRRMPWAGARSPACSCSWATFFKPWGCNPPPRPNRLSSPDWPR